MKNDFMVAIHQVCHERQLPLDTVLEAVEVALISAYKRGHAGSHSITAQINPKSGAAEIYVEKVVVPLIHDVRNEITLDEALEIDPKAHIGALVSVLSTPKNFGRIAAQTAKQVILQRIREAERDALYNQYADREGEVVNGTVHKIEPHQVTLSLGNVEAYLPRNEQIPTERYNEGQRLRAYVSAVNRSSRGPSIIVSRTHRTMLRRLLEVEVPEIYNGTVEIKSIAREAGFRSKVAVAALQEGVDPVGSCVGMRGSRIQNIVTELNGEKIDVVQWNPDIGYYIASALSPAKVTNVMLYDEKGKTATVVVPDKQLSLAIGKEGQNARLAAKLTGWRIDIKSVHEAVEEVFEKIRKDDAVRDKVAHRNEVFNMAKVIHEDKDPVAYSEGELKLLSEAIEIVNIAEMTIRRKKKAELVAQAKAMREAAKDMDILAQAEAILLGELPTIPSDEEVADAMTDGSAEPSLDDLAMALLSGASDEMDVESDVVATVEAMPAVDAEPDVDTVEKPVRSTKIEPAIAEKAVVEKPKPAITDEARDLMSQAAALLRQEAEASDDDDDDDDETDKKKKARRKKRRLVYDEELGEVIAQRRRKKSRRGESWQDY